MNIQKNRLLIAFILVIVLASLIRFWCLDLRPFHSDEGVNAHFLLDLYNKNYYHYDPSNYHGPFLYYIGLIPFYILGITDFSFRLMPALFGIMVVALLFPLRRRMGIVGVTTSGLLLAISPATSFFSRDTIHEIYMIFFSLAVVVSFFLYSETKKTRYIYLGVASLAFTVTVKETYIITFSIYAISLAVAYASCWFKDKSSILIYPQPITHGQQPGAIIKGGVTRNLFSVFFSGCWEKRYAIIISIALFISINILFYSSFFTYYAGIKDILTALKIWTQTGTHGAGGHAKPFIYYLKLMSRFELPMLVLGVCGFYYSFRGRDRFVSFTASWTVLIYVVYSLIPYKTPWLVLNILLPLSIMAGIFTSGLFERLKKGWRYACFYPIYACIFGFFSYQSIMLNFINYDDERYELVYVQTKRDIYNLLDMIKRLADICGKDMQINVLAHSYWPLPWYLRGYRDARFWGHNISNPNAPIVLVDKEGEEGFKNGLNGAYEIKRFVLRPGVWIAAYIQQGLYDAVYGKKEMSKKRGAIKSISRDELKSGLWAQYYHNIECLGDPFLSKVEDKPISFTYHNIDQKPYRSPFAIEWTGYIFIEEKGLYKFATRSDDGSIVYIDEDMIVDNWGFHAMQYISGVILLDEGFHNIRLKYFDGGGGAIMEFFWTPPDGSEALVPAQVLYHN